MRSSNPILRDSVYENAYALTERPMTVAGTMNKLLILTVVMLLAAVAVYYQFSLHHFDYVMLMVKGGAIVGLITAIIIAFKTNTAPYLSPVYAFAQGAAISGISCFFESAMPGIVIQAMSLTFIVVLAMAILFRTGLVKATERFKAVILTATFAIAIFYIISLVLMLFNVNIPYFTSTSPLAIGINIAIAIIAALNLVIDFDFIEKGARTPLPSVFEWYGAFGLLVTILWLYIEILRLLSRLRNR